MNFTISDDSEMIGLVDATAYRSYVDENWGYEQLLEHFVEQMADERLLVWSTGAEWDWRVRVTVSGMGVVGFREVTGPITATSGELYLISYDDLTMAAQFADVTLPEQHHSELRIPLAPGRYACRIVQLFDPKQPDSFGQANETSPHFVIDLTPTGEGFSSWNRIPWLRL